MKVALVEPDIRSECRTIFVGNNALEPLGLEYLGGVALKCGWTPRLFIERILKKGLMKEVLAFAPDLVALTSLTCNSEHMLALAAEFWTSLGCRIVVGGYHASAVPEHVAKNDDIDWVVVGEGELAFEAILQSLAGTDNSLPPGKIIGMPRIESFADLPRPYREPVVLAQSRLLGLMVPGPSQQRSVAVVSAGRGCANDCDFCAAKTVWGDMPAVLRSPEDLVDEIHDIVDRFGVDAVLFADLAFNASQEHLRAICTTIIRSGLRFSWYCMCCMHGLTPETLSLMSHAGCRKVGIGIESPVLNVRRRIKRGHVASDDELAGVVQAAAECGIFVKAYFMAGYPWETWDSLSMFSEKLLAVPYDEIKISFFTPFPGTRAYREYEHMLDADDWSRFDTVSRPVLVNLSISAEDIIEWRREVFCKYYTSAAYLGRVAERCAGDPTLRDSYRDFARQLEPALGVSLSRVSTEAP